MQYHRIEMASKNNWCVCTRPRSRKYIAWLTIGRVLPRNSCRWLDMMAQTIFLILFVHMSTITMTVDVFPTTQVSAPGGNAVLVCLPSSTDGLIVRIKWLFNGTVYDGSSVNVSTTFSETTRTGRLILRNISKDFNATRIQCTAFTSIHMAVTSSAAVLVIQGLLDPVDSLVVTEQNDIITLTWLPPFTLDIPSEDDDIRGYCVDVFNSTSNMLIYSECGISATLFQYPKPNDTVCHNYTFTVTPVNVVGNGTSNTIIYGVETSRPEVDKLLVPRSQRKYEIKMTAPVCTCKLIILNTTYKINHTVMDTVISFTTEQLPVNRHYNVTVNATNAAGSTLSSPITISTHDIMNATATGNTEEFVVLTTYFEQSNASGALFNFAYLNDKGDLSFHLLPLNKNDSMEYNIPNFLLYKSIFRISVYDIESDGVLFTNVHVSYPAVTMEETGTEQSSMTTTQEGISCSHSLDIISTLIKITCTNNNSSISGIQFIAQSSDLKGREKLYVSERVSIDTMTEILIPVEVESLDEAYQITGFGIGEMIDSIVYTNRVESLATGTLATMETIMCCVLIGVLGAFI